MLRSWEDIQWHDWWLRIPAHDLAHNLVAAATVPRVQQVLLLVADVATHAVKLAIHSLLVHRVEGSEHATARVIARRACTNSVHRHHVDGLR